MAKIYSKESIKRQGRIVSPNTTKGLLIDIYDIELYRTGDKDSRICSLISELFNSKNIGHLLPNNENRVEEKKWKPY